MPDRRKSEDRLGLLSGIDRLPYAGLGILLLLVKCTLDFVVAQRVFKRPWSLFNYLSEEQVTLTLRATPADRPFYALMLALALPFIGAGVLLTLKRLRAASLPPWLVVLFFVPTINLPFFVVLSLVPSRPASPQRGRRSIRASGGTVERIVPRGPRASAGVAISLTAIVGLLLTGFNIYALGVYGLGLFVGMPFCLGLIAATVYGMRSSRGLRGCVTVGVAAVAAVGALLILLAVEGAACLIMAAPLWVGCAALGGVVGYFIQRHARDEREVAVMVIGLVLAIPALMGAEFQSSPQAPVFAVRTSIDVSAPQQRVWNNVVAFPDLPRPTELLFQTGVAYPIGACIDGTGPGAERRCVFSTGSFVEPIETWDEPRLLKFAVTSNPPPMREWSMYGEIHPPHLQGFLESRAGQFRLTPVPDGGTCLEGTTWYQHHMWPASYWRLWSDHIIHKIHLRVLLHVKGLSEARH